MATPQSLFSTPAAENSEPPLTIQDVMAMLARQAVLILVTVSVLTAVTFWLMGGQKKTYTTTARLWVQTEQQGTPAFLSGLAAYRDSPYPDPVARKIETEMELLLTRSNAAEVIRRYKVTEDQLAFKPMDHVKNKVGKLFGLDDELPGASKQKGMSEDALIDQLLKGVKITPRRSGTADTSSNVLEVELEVTDEALAPKALATLIEGYLKLSTAQSQQQAAATSRLIERQMIQARDELRAVESEMTDIMMRQSRRADGELSEPGGARAIAGADIGNDRASSITTMKNFTLDLQSQLEQARQLYTDDAEPVKAIRRRLEAAEARLRQGMGQGVKTTAELGRLERQRSLAQDRYVELRKRLDQIELYLQANEQDINSRTLVDKPSQPGASGKAKVLMLMALGPLLGLFLGLLLAGIREFLDNRLRTPANVRLALGLPVLAELSVMGRTARRELDQHNG